MWWLQQGLSILPIALVTWTAATFIFAYITAVTLRHVDPLVPYISDTGTVAPERCVFGLMLDVSAFLGIATTYVRYKQMQALLGQEEKTLHNVNQLGLVLGSISSSGMCVVANFQDAFGRFAAECEAVGMRVSTSKSEAMVLCRKTVDCSLRVGSELLPQVKEFQTVVVKRELSRNAKLSIYQSIYVPTLNYGHELRVVTIRTRSQIHAAKMSSLRRVAGLSLRDRVRSSDIWRELRVEPLLLHVERSQLRSFGHLIRMPPGRPPWRFSGHSNGILILFFWVDFFGLKYAKLQSFKCKLSLSKTTLFPMHIVGAVLTFGVGALYIVAQTLLSFHMQPHVHSKTIFSVRLSIGVWTITMFVSSVVMYSSLPGVDVAHKLHWTPGETGYTAHIISTISEWSLAFSFISFFFTYIRDFQKINLRAETDLQSYHLYDSLHDTASVNQEASALLAGNI
ncbi:DNA damage-regulated autophagy modulator protein 2 [Merluccius polli]|uniref:DNA damage-regulated autophagy modulator protein 2 n=1 Tax=Merluccius polli TaxID=89951 RepID=A0AA47MT72_MERPO|nr:DNA damage-regulated autophagy modulator protein 2 [Merluccius polli]